MRSLFILVLAFFAMWCRGQDRMNTDTTGKRSTADNIFSIRLFGDSLATSFVIIVKNAVKPHKHLYHSEHILVTAGEATMKVQDREFRIRKGDVVFIPKGWVHSVKTLGKTPLKVISIQSPGFDGSDRVWVE